MSVLAVQEILISHHSHTDIGYTHEQPVLWELQNRFIEQAMDLIEETHDFPAGSQLKWTCEVSAPVVRWLKTAPARQVERFVRMAKDGRIEVMALYCNLTPLYDLEELYRAVLPALRLEREFGIPVRTAMNSDVNGLPWPIVDILLDAGVTGLTMAINVHMGGAPFKRPHAFRWVGPSGRSIVAYNGLHYGWLQRYGLGERGVEEAHREITKWLEENPLPDGSPLLYVQNTRLDFWDNNPPQEKLAPFVREWNEAGFSPRLTLVTPHEAIRRLGELPAGLVPEHRGDWTDYWNFGSGSSAEPVRINRRSRRYLVTGDQIGSLCGRPARDVELSEEAWQQLMLFDEHTWGAWCSISQPDAEFTRAQWAFKEGYGNTAAALSQFTRREAVAALASRVKYEGGGPAVFAYNPGARPVVRRLVVPKRWDNADLPANLSHRHSWDTYERVAADTLTTKPVELPPLGWSVFSLSEINTAAEAGEAGGGQGGRATDAGESGQSVQSGTGAQAAASGEGAQAALSGRGVQAADPGQGDPFEWDESTLALRTPFYELRIDPDRPGVAGWKSRRTGREFVDASAYAFGQVVLEQNISKRKRSAFWNGETGWQPDWAGRRIAAAASGKLKVERAPGSISLSQEIRLPEMPPLTWTLRAFSERSELEFVIEGRLPDRTDPEALYMVLPLASEKRPWKAWYTTAGQSVQYDAEQLPGTCRDYVTTDTWVYMETGGDPAAGAARGGSAPAAGSAATGAAPCGTVHGPGIQVIFPDNPLVMLGGFNFGKRLFEVEPSSPAWIVPWICNNYWQTNFRAAQPGPVRQRYWVVPHEAEVDDAELHAVADDLLVEPVLHPVPRPQAGDLPPRGSLLYIRPGPARLVAIKEAISGQGVIVRLQNPAHGAVEVLLSEGAFRFARAWECDAAERALRELPVEGGTVRLALQPVSTGTFMLAHA